MKNEINWQICQGLQTRIYRNLRTGTMSLQQKFGNSWLVIGHVTDVVIKHPKFYVSEPGRKRVIKERQKNVHAYSTGTLVNNIVLEKLPDLQEIYYCPYAQSYFSWKQTGEPITQADLLVVIDNRVFCPVEVKQPQLSLF
jgi:hypothetical protein